jgi:inhibitor of KinA sporulation pathway (predicted exonuclease)
MEKSNIRYILTIDLELTCDDHPNWSPEFQEIIEIGWVLSDLEYNIIKEGQFFVKPLRNRIISDYCTKLTGITQEDVKYEKKLSVAVHNWYNELECPSNEIMLAGWGNDAEWLKKELKEQGYDLAFDYNYINIKLADQLLYKRPQGRRGLKAVCESLNLSMESPQHRALPDAKTAFKVLKTHKLGVLDYAISKDRTYKQALTRKYSNMVDKLVKRSNLTQEKSLKLLQYTDYDFTKALNIFKLLKED